MSGPIWCSDAGGSSVVFLGASDAKPLGLGEAEVLAVGVDGDVAASVAEVGHEAEYQQGCLHVGAGGIPSEALFVEDVVDGGKSLASVGGVGVNAAGALVQLFKEIPDCLLELPHAQFL